MPEKSKFSEKQHKLAWKLYRSGQSFRQIADSEGMPSHSLIAKWAGDYDCPYNCEYHSWEAKRREIMDQALEEVDKELPDPVERDKERLRNLNMIEEQLFKMLEEGELKPPKKTSDAVQLLEKLLNMNRLLRGESTEITEQRGNQGSDLNLQKIAKQLNVENFEEVVHAAEETIIEEGREQNGEN